MKKSRLWPFASPFDIFCGPTNLDSDWPLDWGRWMYVGAGALGNDVQGVEAVCGCDSQEHFRLEEMEKIMIAFRWNFGIASLLFAVCIGSPASAQQDASSSAPAAPAWSPSQNIGMFAFPKNGQNADQQLKDESDCYGMAKQRTGLDPQKPAPAGPTAEQVQAAQKQAAANADQVKGARVAGAARGAAGGAAIGAIAGDAGKGAGAGAVAGTMRGGAAQRSANAQSQQKAAAQAKANLAKEHEQELLAHKEGLDTFQRAFAACMDARGYSVK